NGQELLRQGLAAGDGKLLGEALALADPAAAARCPLDWGQPAQALTGWVGRLFQSDDPYSVLAEFWQSDPVPAAGLWLPAAVLHLRDAQQFVPFCDPVRQGLARPHGGIHSAEPPAERYPLLHEDVALPRPRHAPPPPGTPALPPC